MYPTPTTVATVVVESSSCLDADDQASARPLCRQRKVGYSRVPNDDQVALREAVIALQTAGVDSERINVDRSASNGPRPFLTETLSRLSAGDRLLVPSLASLARSTGELATIVQLLDARGVQLWVGGRRFAALNATDTVELVAQMSADLLRVAESKDRQRAVRFRTDHRGEAQQLTAVECLELRQQFDAHAAGPKRLAEHWKVSRATMYRAVGPSVVKRSPS